MMGTKVWAALCALLLVNSGSADHQDDHVTMAPTPRGAPATEAGPVSPAVVPVPGPSPDPIGPGGNDSDASVSPGNTTTKQEIIPVTATPGDQSEKGVNTQAWPPSQTPLSTSDSQASTSHPATTLSSEHKADNSSGEVVTTPSSPHSPSHLPPDAATSSNQPNATEAPPAPVATTSEPPKPQATSAAATTHASSTPSPTPSHRPPNSTPTLEHAPTTDSHHQESTKAQPASSSTTAAAAATTTTTTLSSPSAPAKTHGENQSQLNVGEEPTMVHDSPPLDPLLAGLMSAFIITAVIIVLLLFLKLRRNNRPEFRRLQDLPMDDMMEDTPLSMYSY